MKYIVKYDIISDTSFITNTISPDMDRIVELGDWFTKLEKSILKYGIKNPVVLTATKENITPRYGGCRVFFAKKYQIPLPSIVADFYNRLPNAEVIVDFNKEIPSPTKMDNIKFKIRSKFIDEPKHIIFKRVGINMSGCRDSHLDD